MDPGRDECRVQDGGAEADGHAGASRKFYIFSTDAESLNYTSLVVQLRLWVANRHIGRRLIRLARRYKEGRNKLRWKAYHVPIEKRKWSTPRTK